ncbi:MAG: galactose-1-phosphate uridylyltransferase, partial [Pseudomonadota bacterium]
MTDERTVLAAAAAEKPVHRRHFRKADGRDLFVYGYAPHTLAPAPEDPDDLAKGGEMRWHPTRREWNIYAAHRQNRTYKPSAADNPLAPTLPGKPATEIPFADFELAIFENKFTSLHPEAVAPDPVAGAETRRAAGRCEVVVYSPAAEGSLNTIGQEKRRLLIAAWIDRYAALFDLGCRFVMPFESRGDEVGVTLHHPHGQIYGFSHVPAVEQNAVDAFADGYDLAGDIEAITPTFGVCEAGGLSAFCPPYARFPLEVWIAARQPVRGPWDFSEEQCDGFAHLLGDITRRYDQYFGRPTAYMLGLHAAPSDAPDSYQFTAQFYPILRAPDRVKFLASVEQHTGVFTVDVMPERAAD